MKPSTVTEVITRQLPGEIVEELSRQKAEDVALSVPEGIVIGADTIVWKDGHIMGKPVSREHAREMLRELQGSTHSVFTGVTVLVRDASGTVGHTFSVETKVHVCSMTEQETEKYLDTGSPMGDQPIHDAAKLTMRTMPKTSCTMDSRRSLTTS